MAQPTNKERIALNVTELGKLMKESPKSVTDSDKYGKSVWFDLTTWDDGSKSLSGYNPETKSTQTPQQASTMAQATDDLPF
jgi:hypothetical protein